MRDSLPTDHMFAKLFDEIFTLNRNARFYTLPIGDGVKKALARPPKFAHRKP